VFVCRLVHGLCKRFAPTGRVPGDEPLLRGGPWHELWCVCACVCVCAGACVGVGVGDCICACGAVTVFMSTCVSACVSVPVSVQATITLTGSENIEKKLVAVANGLRVFIFENPAPEKPMLGEAHARECNLFPRIIHCGREVGVERQRKMKRRRGDRNNEDAGKRGRREGSEDSSQGFSRVRPSSLLHSLSYPSLFLSLSLSRSIFRPLSLSPLPLFLLLPLPGPLPLLLPPAPTLAFVRGHFTRGVRPASRG
jgi:hypothetical protein